MHTETPAECVVDVGGEQCLAVPISSRARVVTPDKLPGQAVEQAIAHTRAIASKSKEEKEVAYWQDGVNPDLCWVQFILDTEGANLNWDYMPRPELVKGYVTARFKPMDMDHIVEEDKRSLLHTAKSPRGKNTIFGVMTHSALAWADGTLMSDKEIKGLDLADVMNRKSSEKVAVVAWAALWNFMFPETVKDVVKYAEKDNLYVSMERWLQKFDYLVREGNSYKSVGRDDAKKLGIETRWKKRQYFNESPILRRAVQFVYGGVATTLNPANPACNYLKFQTETDADARVEKAAATVLERHADDPTVKNLAKRHDEVVGRYAVTSCEDQRRALVEEHRRITNALAAYLR
jgi:hypothetical protein